MRVKKYRGATLAEAVEQVKLEMGPDALILQTRKVQPGGFWFWLRRRWFIEVTAAAVSPGLGGERETAAAQGAAASLAPARPPALPPVMSPPSAPRVPPAPPVSSAPPAPPAPPPSPVLPQPPAPLAERGARDTASGDAGDLAPASPLAADVQQVKELVGAIWRQVQLTREGPHGAEIPYYPEALDPVYQALLQSEVEPSLARCVADALLEKGEGKGTGLLRQEAMAMIERLLGPGRPIELSERGRVVALVGPTGVGKTTTLAKLAAYFALGFGKKVALVTLDTFRVGAVEQLRTYAEIAGLPSYVANNPKEMAAILDRVGDHDLVLMDTTGRNPRDEMHLSEMLEFWSERRPDEVHLVLSATIKYSDALEVVERYRLPGFDRILFTKLDETTRHGLLLNLSVVAQRPLSYITTGQNVPEDIAVARAGDLAKLIL